MDLDGLAALYETLLDDADVDVALDARTATITLDFMAGGSRERVVIRCSRFWRFRYAKAGDDAEAVFVGETRVSMIEGREAVWQALKEDWRELGEQTPSRLFRVTTEGGAMIDIRARDEWFPFANKVVYAGCCVGRQERAAVLYCEACRRELRDWRGDEVRP